MENARDNMEVPDETINTKGVRDMEKTKIIVDCDTGLDDAVALVLAAKHPALELHSITVVAGNQTLDKTVRNTLSVCQMLNIDVPVYAGCDRPLVRVPVNAGEVHGDSGLGDITLPPLERKAEQKHAVLHLIDTLMASGGDITLIPVGPLTNIAMAIRLEPGIVKKIRRIVLMGGAYGFGNVTPSAEFNIFADPEAASVVFTSGAEIVMVGLDVTNKTAPDMGKVEMIEAIGNKASSLAAGILRFLIRNNQEIDGPAAGAMHDGTAVSFVACPEIFTAERMQVEIDLTHGTCYGRTVCLPKADGNALVATSVDYEKLWKLMADTIACYGE